MMEPEKFTIPFAANGDRAETPLTATGNAASLNDGFPQITSTAKNIGGELPRRDDFNGIFYGMSSFSHFEQSGGVFAWSKAANYAPPCVVYHKGGMWWNVKACGADDTPQEPTKENSSYWIPFYKFLIGNAEAMGIGIDSPVYPVGTILPALQISSQPDEGQWAICDGASATQYPEYIKATGLNTLPDFRGLFLRAAGSQTQEGTTYSATLGKFQGDAIRNISGHFAADDGVMSKGLTGAFKRGAHVNYDADSNSSTTKYDAAYIEFNASNVVPTAGENRPASMGVYWIIKTASTREGGIKPTQYVITVIQTAHQTISYKANGVTYTTSQAFDSGTKITGITLTPDDGYNAGALAVSADFTLLQNATLSATEATAIVIKNEDIFTVTVHTTDDSQFTYKDYEWTAPEGVSKIRVTAISSTPTSSRGLWVKHLTSMHDDGNVTWLSAAYNGKGTFNIIMDNRKWFEGGETAVIHVTAGKKYTLRGDGQALYRNRTATATFKIEWGSDINKLNANVEDL